MLIQLYCEDLLIAPFQVAANRRQPCQHRVVSALSQAMLNDQEPLGLINGVLQVKPRCRLMIPSLRPVPQDQSQTLCC